MSIETLTKKKKANADNGWMDDLQFYGLFNSISVISGPWADGNERLCAMEPCLHFEKILPLLGIELGPLDQ